MDLKPVFYIYRSSAGSGKTYNLTREYLKLALGRPDKFKHILAVTFTNKATNEMKSRIIGELYRIAAGNITTPMAINLVEDLDLNPLQLQEKALLVLRSILHDYSHFAISTIDSFFQKVINGFARDLGLQGGYQVDLDLDHALSEITDLMFLELDQNPELLEWLIQFSHSRMEEEKSWDIRNEIVRLGKEIFKESYNIIRGKLGEEDKKVETVIKIRNELSTIKFGVEQKMKNMAIQALNLITDTGFQVDDFAYGKTGVAGYFYGIINKQRFDYGKRVTDALIDPGNWVTKKSPVREELLLLVRGRLHAMLEELTRFYDKIKLLYNSASEIYRFLYAYGLLSFLVDKLGNYREDHGVILISDLSVFLKAIIGSNDAPFIYEKVGIFYDHFLMDEFQDTSALQWSNFLPLIKNTIAQGRLNLVVGDVKQAVYRWRGGDWQILEHDVEQDIGKEYLQNFSLSRNWRSHKNIVSFNNFFFSKSVSILSQFLEDEIPLYQMGGGDKLLNLKKAYTDILQDLPQNKMDLDEGYVNIRFINGHEPVNESEPGNFKDRALIELTRLFEQLQDSGYSIRDIAILVRSNKEGQEVVNYMLEYSGSAGAKKQYKYDVISSEALALGASASVKVLVNTLRFILDPGDDIARINLVYYYQNLKQKKNIGTSHHVLRTAMEASLNIKALKSVLPSAFIDKYSAYPGMPVNEVVSSIITDLEIDQEKGEFPYLLGFQDAVHEFILKQRSDIKSFLLWWDEQGSDRSITLPQNQEAARILTIHKSKGLEFKVVILPFCNWKFDPDARKDNILWTDIHKTLPDFSFAIPLKYSGRLANTYYSNEYYEEKVMSYIDNLNLTYVAFTRASEALFAFAPEADRNGAAFKPDTAGKLINEVMQNKDQLNDYTAGSIGYWDDASKTFSLGTLKLMSESEINSDDLTLENFTGIPWQSRISFRRRAENVFVKDQVNKKSQLIL